MKTGTTGVSHRTVLTRCLIGLLFLPGPVEGQDPLQGRTAAGSLGSVEFPISCRSEVRPEFERAVALLHHMTYPQAREAFEGVAERDPNCAMAHWGVAMTLFQPLWPNRPDAHALRRGWDAVRHARSLGPVTDRERRFLDAAEAFFREGPESVDYWTRIERWERASAALHQAHPEDPEAAALHALARLALAQRSGSGVEDRAAAAQLLLAIHQRNPLHPGAIHYTIHANDAAGRERESLAIVRSYGRIAPDNPHALHMPTHIFVRLGSWPDVIEGNRRAADAALRHPAGEYVWDEFPHAIEYLVYAHLQRGDDEAAATEMRRLLNTAALQPTFKTAFHLASIPARHALERGAWREAAALEPREPEWVEWDRYPWPEAITWFARGLRSARTGDLTAARASLERLAELRNRADEAGEPMFAREIEILMLEAEAWIARGSGDAAQALQLLNQAASLEDATPKNPVTPAPTVPARQLLGDLLLDLDRPREALAAYEHSLRNMPGTFNSLLGAARAAAAAGDPARARTFYERLLQQVVPGSTRPGVSEARRYLEAAAPAW